VVNLVVPRGRLDLATYINTKTFKIEGDCVFVNHYSWLLFPSRTSQKPLVPTRRIGCMIRGHVVRGEGGAGVLGPRPHHHEEEECDPL